MSTCFATCLCVYLNLLTEKIRNKEPDIGWAFCKAAHEVWVPMRTERDVDTDRVALFDELFLQIAADAIQHLKLDRVLWQANFFGILFCKRDAFIVMSCN